MNKRSFIGLLPFPPSYHGRARMTATKTPQGSTAAAADFARGREKAPSRRVPEPLLGRCGLTPEFPACSDECHRGAAADSGMSGHGP